MPKKSIKRMSAALFVFSLRPMRDIDKHAFTPNQFVMLLSNLRVNTPITKMIEYNIIECMTY